MRSGARAWRVAAGFAVLAALLLIAVLLAPPYVKNWKLQQYLNDLSANPATAQRPGDAIQANVINEADSLGLPVHGNDVHVSRSDGAWHVEVLYIVHVDLAAYSVDLHFRPTM